MLSKLCSFDYSDAKGNRSSRTVCLTSVDYQDDKSVPPHLSITAYDFTKGEWRRFKAHNCFNFHEANLDIVKKVAWENLEKASEDFSKFATARFKIAFNNQTNEVGISPLKIEDFNTMSSDAYITVGIF